MKTICSRLGNKRGFTLAEMLMVVLILMLAGSIATVGIRSAANSYKKVVDSANAQMLLSTTVSSLRRELAMASASNSGGATITYTNGDLGYEMTLCNDVNKGISRQWTDTATRDYALVTEKAATKGMISSFSSITYANGIFTVSNLKIEKDGATLVKLNNPIVIRSVMLRPTPSPGP